ELPQLALIRRSPAPRDGPDVGEDQQSLGFERDREQRGGAVLVDHRVDAVQAAVAGGNRNAAASARDRDRARGEERADRVDLDHLERLRRGDDAPPAAACVLTHGPAALALELARLSLRVERTDWLRRL